MVELAKKELKLPCRIGKPQRFLNLETGPDLSTVCGLVLEGMEIEGEGAAAENKVISRIKNFFKHFFLP